MFFKKKEKPVEAPPKPVYKFFPGENEKYIWLQKYNIKNVLDIGAHKGESIANMNAIFSEINIYSFEPIKQNFVLLNEKYGGKSNVKLYNVALGEENKMENINVNEFTPSSSIMEITEHHTSPFPFTSKTKTEQIEVKRMDSVWNDLGVNDNILAKIDTQGYELSVLKGFGEHLRKIDVFIIETSFKELYKNQPLFSEIYSFLIEKGFVYIGSWDQLLDPYTGEIIQQDAVFINKAAK